MPPFYLRGALVEYGTDILGPIPNIVVFQFNPEELQRTLNMANSQAASPEADARQREPAQTSAPPTETLQFTAHFSAADDLGAGGALSSVPRAFGIGPQLVALEKMVYPVNGLLAGAIGDAVDAIGAALGGGDDEGATRQVPREPVPRILFVWGPSRVLPVQIRSMSITEQKFDMLLNPVQAQVQIGLAVAQLGSDTSDKVGYGALQFTQAVKDAQVALNLAKAAELAIDVIPF